MSDMATDGVAVAHLSAAASGACFPFSIVMASKLVISLIKKVYMAVSGTSFLGFGITLENFKLFWLHLRHCLSVSRVYWNETTHVSKLPGITHSWE